MWAPPGSGDEVTEAARDNGASTVLTLHGGVAGGTSADVRVVQAPNRRVEEIIGALSDLDGVHISFLPQGVLELAPPVTQPQDRVEDVTLRSPVEIFLSGLQSVGSWRGFLSYAALGGLIAWTGLLTNTAYLLIGAMLIAPFAGPAMNAAMATARGDAELLLRSIGRYAAAIATTVAVAAVATLLYRLGTPTILMGEVSSVAATAVLLPLAAGAAGAINLAQSERASLVSGAATGLLVAAALAPPAGVVGMAAAIGEWGMAGRAGFVLVLQLVGINLAGAMVFRAVGLSPQGARFARGRPAVRRIATAVSVVLVTALMTLQFQIAPVLQRATVAQRAEALVADTVARHQATLLAAEVRFPAYGRAAVDTVLVTGYVLTSQPTEDLTEAVTQALAGEFDVTPIVSLTAVTHTSGDES